MVASCRDKAVDGGGLSRGQPRERSGSQGISRVQPGKKASQDGEVAAVGCRLMVSMNEEEEVVDGLGSLG